jgi:hypothetical protein
MFGRAGLCVSLFAQPVFHQSVNTFPASYFFRWHAACLRMRHH